MSVDLNSVVLVGRLVRDPEVRYTPSGTAVARFSIANGYRTKQNNEWKDDTSYFDIVAWGNQAVNCEKFLKKGSQVAIHGELRQNRWLDQATNQNRSKVEVVANSVQFLSQPVQQGQPAPGGFAQTAGNYTQQPPKNIKPVQQQQPQQQGGFIPDPWGDSSFSGPGADEQFSGQQYESDDDIPF